MSLHYYFYVYLSNQKSTAVCIFYILMLTYFYTFCTLIHLGEFYLSEMQYTVGFLFTTIFQSCRQLWLNNKKKLGLYYNHWTTFAEQVVNYMNKIIIGHDSINSIMQRVSRLHNYPNGSCLFMTGLLADIVGSQNFQTFSTSSNTISLSNTASWRLMRQANNSNNSITNS